MKNLFLPMFLYLLMKGLIFAILCVYLENEQSRKNSLPFIDSIWFWYLFLSQWKNTSILSSASSLIMTSMLLLLECITRSSSLSMEQIKLFAIYKVNSSTCYFSTGTVLFLSSLLSYSIQLLLQKSPVLTGLQ